MCVPISSNSAPSLRRSRSVLPPWRGVKAESNGRDTSRNSSPKWYLTLLTVFHDSPPCRSPPAPLKQACDHRVWYRGRKVVHIPTPEFLSALLERPPRSVVIRGFPTNYRQRAIGKRYTVNRGSGAGSKFLQGDSAIRFRLRQLTPSPVRTSPTVSTPLACRAEHGFLMTPWIRGTGSLCQNNCR